MSHPPNQIALTFPGDEEELEGALVAIQDFLTSQYASNFRNAFNTELVLREVITNAIVHGCPKKEEVTVEITAEKESFLVRVFDRGPLFSLEPTAAPDSLLENSRGLWILHKFTQNVQLHENPKCLEFTINIKTTDQ